MTSPVLNLNSLSIIFELFMLSLFPHYKIKENECIMLCQLHRYFGKIIKCYLVSKKSVQQYRSLASAKENKNSQVTVSLNEAF